MYRAKWNEIHLGGNVLALVFYLLFYRFMFESRVPGFSEDKEGYQLDFSYFCHSKQTVLPADMHDALSL